MQQADIDSKVLNSDDIDEIAELANIRRTSLSRLSVEQTRQLADRVRARHNRSDTLAVASFNSGI